MGRKEILIVGADLGLRDFLTSRLGEEGIALSSIDGAPELLAGLERKRPGLLILDGSSLGSDLFRVLEILARQPGFRGLGILVLGEEAELARWRRRRVAKELSVDSLERLTPRRILSAIRARIALMSGQLSKSRDVLEFQDLRIDPLRHEVELKGAPVALTLTEFRVLYLLASKPGAVISRSEIIEELRGSDRSITERAVDVQIVGLRRKLGELRGLVRTAKGEGYYFEEME